MDYCKIWRQSRTASCLSFVLSGCTDPVIGRAFFRSSERHGSQSREAIGNVAIVWKALRRRSGFVASAYARPDASCHCAGNSRGCTLLTHHHQRWCALGSETRSIRAAAAARKQERTTDVENYSCSRRSRFCAVRKRSRSARYFTRRNKKAGNVGCYSSSGTQEMARPASQLSPAPRLQVSATRLPTL